MRIAYVLTWRSGRDSGILRKVAGQVAEWSRCGHEVGLFVGTSSTAEADWAALPQARLVSVPPGPPAARLRQRETVTRAAARWAPDVVYTRHGLVHPALLALAGRRPMVVEVNGDDVVELALRAPRQAAYSRLTRGSLLRRAAGLVFVTDELAALPHFRSYRRPTVVIANGIALDLVSPAPPVRGEPRVVFVGHPGTPWHGVDRLLALARLRPGLTVDVVGPRPADLPGQPSNVTAHGLLTGAALEAVVAGAHVGIGSLALSRAGLREACTLKVRQYLAAGLPVALAYQDTDFPDDRDFLLRLPDTEEVSPASAAALERFARSWAGRRVDRAEVAHLDTPAKEARRLGFFEEVSRSWS